MISSLTCYRASCACALSLLGLAADAGKPNVIVILADDLGYADLGCQGSVEVVSPRIDSIAKNGARLTSGYVTAPQCSPARAGFVSGRYQNRFGFECNIPPSCRSWGGLPAGVQTIGDRMRALGYVTGMIGKWHLGEREDAHPYNRGFDETFWHPNGGVLLPNKVTGLLQNVYRGQDRVEETEYSTDAFGREAAAFIDRHQDDPFFLFLSFVPPHWPMQAKPEHMEQLSHVEDMHRRTMLAMMASLDENVGRVLDMVRDRGLEEDTLIFFFSDNGGPTGAPRNDPDAPFQYGQNTSLNDPCRGVKGDLLEGGIRIPFLVQWKGQIQPGSVKHQAVTALDILPTALAAAGASLDQIQQADTDGVNILPLLKGESSAPVHETLCWRFRFPLQRPTLHSWAVRQGDWKLVKNRTEPVSLYNLADDISETNDLAAEHPERVHALRAAWEEWDAQNRDPLWEPVRQRMTRSLQAKVRYLADEIYVECEGDDPQILFSGVPMAPGPYTLHVRMKSESRGNGSVFWTTTKEPEFAAESCEVFTPTHDGNRWRDYTVALPKVNAPISHLRFDPGEAPGLVRIARFTLLDASGAVIKSWVGQEIHKPSGPQH